MPFQGILKQQLLNPYFNHFKKVEVQVCEVGALSAPFVTPFVIITYH
jgi:hypothetical protein